MGLFIAYLLGILTAAKAKPDNRDQFDKSASSPHNQTNPNGPISVVCHPPALTDQEKTEKKKKEKRKTIKFLVEIVGTITLLAYFAVTVLIWWTGEKTAKTASRQLEMIDRPWIKDSVTSGEDFRFEHGDVAMWSINIRAENIGHSVATGIYPWAKLIAINVTKDNPIDGPRRQVKELCESIDQKFEKLKSDPAMWGTSAFPTYWLEFPFGIYLTPEQINNGSLDGGVDLGKSIYPVLIECVAYRYPSSDRPHHAGSVYILSHSDDPNIQEAGRVFFSIGKTIPKDKMVLLKAAQYVD